MSRIPEFNFEEVTVESCNKWICELHNKGLLYHFDDSPETVIEGGTGNTLFTELEVKQLNKIMNAIFSLENYDPFDIAVNLVNGTYKNPEVLKLGKGFVTVELGQDDDQLPSCLPRFGPLRP